MLFFKKLDNNLLMVSLFLYTRLHINSTQKIIYKLYLRRNQHDNKFINQNLIIHI